MSKEPRHIDGVSGIFLDAIRLLAALMVFTVHVWLWWFEELRSEVIPNNLSHGAVVVFFVLSGYVIAHTTNKNQRSFSEYITARLTRLYSIFFPAIIITIICYLIIRFCDPLLFGLFQQESVIKTFFRFIVTSAFCSEIWFQSAAPTVNGPLWSLSYEFWFYVIFGLFFYKKKGCPVTSYRFWPA